MSIFDSIFLKRPKRSLFDLSHEVKMSCKMGDLVPIFCQDVLPGDTFHVNTEIMMRLAPMLAPVMHRVNVFTHYFFVPNRLVWSDWENFITGGPDGQYKNIPPHIDFDVNSEIYRYFQKKKLSDYLGYPVNLVDPGSGASSLYDNGDFVSSIPLRAYQLIYNEYYRDQNLSDPVDINKDGTVDYDEELFKMRKRCWEKDYFTSALPWTQRGGDVSLPGTIGGQLPIVRKNEDLEDLYQNSYNNTLSGTVTFADVRQDPNNAKRRQAALQNGTDARMKSQIDLTNFAAETGSTSGTTINELRRAARLQEWLEKNARAGSRYVEQILSHFGVRSSDARLQRPEFLGGGKSPVVISEVLQTSATDAESPQGNMSGHGIAIGNTHRFRRSFEEHGYIIGIMSVLPKTAYSQGLPKQFQRIDKFDYAFPEFAQLGEQEVYLSELYKQPGDSPMDSTDREIFGYQQRYCEYKYCHSRIAGDFHDNLEFWHLGRRFDNVPKLNKEFVNSDPSKRIFAVTDETEDALYCQLYHNAKAVRCLPKHNVPRL